MFFEQSLQTWNYVFAIHSNNLEVWPGTNLKVIDDLQSHSMNTTEFLSNYIIFSALEREKEG